MALLYLVSPVATVPTTIYSACVREAKCIYYLFNINLLFIKYLFIL